MERYQPFPQLVKPIQNIQISSVIYRYSEARCKHKYKYSSVQVFRTDSYKGAALQLPVQPNAPKKNARKHQAGQNAITKAKINSTKPSPTHHQNHHSTITTHHGDFTETCPRRHQHINEISPKQHQKTNKTTPKKHRDITKKTKTRRRHDQYITGTSPGRDRNNTKTTPKHHRDTNET